MVLYLIFISSNVLDLLLLMQVSTLMQESAIAETRTIVLEPIHCPKCDGIGVIKHGKIPDGKQRATSVRIYSVVAERSL